MKKKMEKENKNNVKFIVHYSDTEEDTCIRYVNYYLK